MREIKFRGKRIDGGGWFYGFFMIEIISINPRYYIQRDRWICPNEIVTERYEVIPETVGQYTGLKDKAGKKIFEGDVARIGIQKEIEKRIGEKGDEVFTFYEIGVMEFDAEFAQFSFKLNSDSIEYEGDKCDAEVIGNIYENPELLGGKP